MTTPKATHYGGLVQRGFTLLELLVVIGIIGILVSIGTVSYTSAQQRSRDSRRRADLEVISRALEQYYAANAGVYPSDPNCSGYTTYLASAAPTDPKEGFEYPSAGNDKSGGTGDFCSASAYCVCVQLEVTGGGNAYGRSATSCTWTGAGSKDYYCVQNLQ